MPQTLAIWVTSALISLDVGASTVAFIGNAILSAGWLGIATALSFTASLFTGSASIPSPGDGKQGKRQPIPPRIRGFGRARVAGYYMCYEEKAGVSYDVLAFHDGKIDAVEEYYLHEDVVTLSAGVVQAGTDGRYGDASIKIATRLGLDTETAYADVIAGLPDIWTDQHRGDGIASLELICKGVSAADYQKIYPNQLPEPSVVARLQLCWDPRDGAQDRNDPSTFTWTKNPVLHLLHYIVHDMDQDVETRIMPEVASWMAAADVCDEDVALAAGGTEKRYEAGGLYQLDNDPADVIGTLLATFDGWLGETGTGGLRVVAGKFYAPTVTLPAAHITGFRVQRFTPDEQAINEIDFSYTDPNQRFTEVQGESWRDEADISARGRTRAKSVSLSWVQSHSQGRRLCKREMYRATSPARGSVQTDLYGFALLGERYVNITLPDLPSLGTFSVQISNATIDLGARTLSFDWIKVGADIDDWDPDTDEGTPPTDPDGVELSAPDIPDAPTGSSEGVSD